MKSYKIFAIALVLAMLLVTLAPAQIASAASICDAAQFVADVTIPDGTSFKPGDTFNKTWRLKNVGTCTWTAGYTLVFVSGDQLSAPTAVKLPKAVAPGQTVDVSATMTAPASAGTYRGYWKLKNTSDKLFGIGINADKSFWVEIKVSASTTGTGYDFVANAASAIWASGAGTLAFPGTNNDAKGFGLKLDNPKLENGTTDSVPGLLMAPQNVTNGFIQAMYPAIRVEKGDRFQATIGCEYGASTCYVNFRLEYQIGSGAPITLWSFNEKYEGMIYRASINLDALAGKDVKFILRINAAGSAAGDRALWGGPSIVRGTGPVVTVTPNPVTPTVTPVGACSDKATFVSDVTVPDGTTFAANAAFVKTWRVRNSGTCTWSTSYSAVYQSGEKFGTTESVNFSKSVAPGQTLDITVNMTAPATNGTYRGYWILKNASGLLYGIGANSDKPFWVEIKVTGGTTATPPTPTATAIVPTIVPGAYAYDFVANACAAQWISGWGVLPCPGANNDAKGFVLVLPTPKIETGATDSRPGLLTFPQSGTNTYIKGIYPAFRVESGDRFQATIGCEHGATSCYVGFRLDYQVGSQPVQNFWAFNEKYEGQVFNADLNLNTLAGKDVKFILTILSNGASTGDRALWVAPRIVRTTGATATATAIPATATATSATATSAPATQTPTPTATPTQPTPTPTGTTSGTSNWNIYENSAYGFSLKFPSGGSIASQTNNEARIQLPIVQGTNLSEKFIIVKVTENAATCNAVDYENGVSAGNVVFNGITFLKETGQGIATGNIYDWQAYSTMKGTNCINLVFVLHSTNPDNWPTPPPLFDQAAESAIFPTIMETFASQ